MFNKFILISGLSMSIFSMSYAQTQDLSLAQNVDKTEATMSIMKGIEDNHVAPENVESFMASNFFSDEFKNSARTLLSSHVRYSDYIKVQKGVYILKSEVQAVNTVYPDHQCVSWSGLESCVYNAGKSCTSNYTNQCS